MKSFQRKEREIFKKGITLLAGADEAGRGPLAGPVVAAAVIFPNPIKIIGIDDSKKLSLPKRLMLEEKIKEKALAYSVKIVHHHIIDAINILNASLLAMKKAVDDLQLLPEFVIVDGTKRIDTNIQCENIIDGDEKCFTIAAASILAKNYRDRLMIEYAEKFPYYDFEKNKGYPTKSHINALLKYGPCEIHRKKFIKKIYERRIEQIKFGF